MKKSYVNILIVLLISILVLVGCSPKTEPESTPVDAEELVLTTEELSEFNGLDGKPAYIAVDGVVYDVSNVEPWKGAKHNGYSAGNDLTEEIKTVSPHGLSKLKGVPIVGKLVD